jgi:hypothetical protein
MAIQTAQFETLSVRQYLATKFPYAAQCFAEDFVGTDRVLSTKVEKWFKHYFPSEVAHQEFRNLECRVTQFIKLK